MKKKQVSNKEKKAQIKVQDLQPKKDAKAGHGVSIPPPGFNSLESSPGNHNEAFVCDGEP